jgi:hydroxyethylthiazole kinase-like sugar kinase family protein
MAGAAERAAANAGGPGSFAVALLDELAAPSS